MNEHIEQANWWYRGGRFLKNLRDDMVNAISAILEPPPAEVIMMIEDFMRIEKLYFTQNKEALKCRDVTKEKQ